MRSRGRKKALAASCAPPAFSAMQFPERAMTGEPLEPPEVLDPAPGTTRPLGEALEPRESGGKPWKTMGKMVNFIWVSYI